MGAAMARTIRLMTELWAILIPLAALGAIGDAELGGAASAVVFLAFVALAQSVHVAAVCVSIVAPDSARAILDGMNAWLERHSRTLLIGLSLVFGVWLIVRSLTALGIL